MRSKIPAWTVAIASAITVILTISALLFVPPLLSGSSKVPLLPQTAAAEGTDDAVLPAEASPFEIQPTGALHTLTIGPAGFLPENTATSWIIGPDWLHLASGWGNLYTGVSLPQGAVVKKFVLYGHDASPSEKIQVFLWRVPVTGLGGEGVAWIESTDSSESVRKMVTTSIQKPTIDNTTYSYSIQVYLSGPAVYLHALKVVYYY